MSVQVCLASGCAAAKFRLQFLLRSGLSVRCILHWAAQKPLPHTATLSALSGYSAATGPA